MSTDLFRRVLADSTIPWRRWGQDALDEARTRDVPLMVCCGEACDHWSAVLAAEFARDTEIATLIAELFVPVAAERLSDPALAARCQEVLALRADASGFPVIAFVTPTGGWFGAVPWRPLRDREQQVGLARILVAVAQTWADDRSAIEADAARVQELLLTAQAAGGAAATTRSPQLILDAAEGALAEWGDALEGGFGPAPRSLGSAALGFLAERCQGDAAPLVLTRLLERTALAWAQSAVCDQLAGGVHRGVADAAWRRPFFEQRLIDQANAALGWLAAADTLERPTLRVAAARCLRWTVDTLGLGDGRYAAGLHADAPDSAGVPREGAFHTWTVDALAAVVGEEAAELLAERFDLVGAPVVEGAHPLAVRAPVAAGQEMRLATALQRLAVARSERLPPLRDERRDVRAEGLLLLALARLRAHEDTVSAAGRALAQRLADESPTSPAAGDASAVALGLHAWTGDSKLARTWIAAEAVHRSSDGRLRISAEAALEPAPLADADDDRGVSGAALLALAHLAVDQRREAAALVAAHTGLLRHGATAAGLLTALAQLQR